MLLIKGDPRSVDYSSHDILSQAVSGGPQECQTQSLVEKAHARGLETRVQKRKFYSYDGLSSIPPQGTIWLENPQKVRLSVLQI